jgi:hypothetical protein
VIIGKEANKIEDQSLFLRMLKYSRDKKEIARKILALHQCDEERMGIGRSTLKFITDGIKKGEVINLNTPAIKRLNRSRS